MKITPLDIVSMIAIASIVISAYAAARASKGQNAKQGKTLNLKRQNQAVL